MGDSNLFDALLQGPVDDTPGTEPTPDLAFGVPDPVGHMNAPAARMLPSGGGSALFPQFHETPPIASLLMPQPGAPAPSWKETLLKSLAAGLGSYAAGRAGLNPLGLYDAAQNQVEQHNVLRYKQALVNAQMLRQQQAEQDAQRRAEQNQALGRLKIATAVQSHIEGLTSETEIAQYKNFVHDYVAPFGIDVDKLPTMPSVGGLQKLRKTYQGIYDEKVKFLKERGADLTDPKTYDAVSVQLVEGGPAVSLNKLGELAYGLHYDPKSVPLAPKKDADQLTESSYIQSGLSDWKKANGGIDPPPPVRDKITGQRRAAWAAMGRAPEKATGDGAGQLPLSAFASGGHVADVTGPVVFNEHALDGLNPMQAEIVKRLNEYKFPISATRNPSKEMVPLIARAGLRDPSFDPNQYAARQKVMFDYTSGKSFTNIKALNTATRHLFTFAKAAEALDNSDYPAINGFVNMVKTQTGDNSVTNFKFAANVVAGEIATLLKGGGATDPEIAAVKGELGDASSPDQLRGVIEKAVEVMGGRMAALQDGYLSGMGRPMDFRIMSKASEGILTRMGFNPATMEKLDDTTDTQTTAPPAGNTPPARNAPADTTGGHKAGDIVRLNSGKLARIISIDPATGKMKFQAWDFFVNLRGLHTSQP